MLARRHVRAPARYAALAAVVILLRLAGPACAAVTSIGSVNPVPPVGGGTFTTALVVGDDQAADPDVRAWVEINGGTALQYGTLTIGDEEEFLGVVNVLGDFLAGVNTKLTLSAGGSSQTPTVRVGFQGTGYLNVRGGTTMTLTNSQSDMSIGDEQTGVGYVTVTDPFTMLTLSENFYIGRAGMGHLEVLNGALVRTIDRGSTRFISIGTNLTGLGTVVVDGQGSILRSASSLRVGELGQGTLKISNGGMVDADNGLNGLDPLMPTVNRVGLLGRIELDGGTYIGFAPTAVGTYGTVVDGYVGGSGLLRGSVDFRATGTLGVGPGDLLQFTGNVSNQGSATIDRGEVQFLAGFANNAQGVLAAPGRISLEDGTVRFSETLTNAGVISSSRGTNNVHGVINNTGTVIVASDTVAVFHDTFLVPGSVTVLPRGNALFLANMVFTSAALLEMGVGLDGTTDTSGQIGVAGSVSLGGSLTVNVNGGFTPTLGQSFDLITSDSGISGTFSSIAVPDIPGPNEFRVIYNPTSVRLVVADELSSVMPGDFNGDFVVDAADYVVWRNDANRTQAQYDLWRAHFGSTFGSGAGSLSDSRGSTVPEPGSGVLLVGGLLLGGRMLYLNRRTGRWAAARVCFTEAPKARPSCQLKVVAPCCVSISTARS